MLKHLLNNSKSCEMIDIFLYFWNDDVLKSDIEFFFWATGFRGGGLFVKFSILGGDGAESMRN